MKKSVEEPFSGNIFTKKQGELGEKIIDIEACGQLEIKGYGPVKSFQFHHLAPVGITAQSDSVILYKVVYK